MPSPIDARELLEHLDFIRGLARALVEDRHEADDVSQDALVAALGARPRIHSSLRNWLAGVIRNQALLRRRGEGRRARSHARARQAQRSDEGEWVEDAVERAELRRRVVEAVVALPDPYRLTVILRYMEELTPSRIAELTNTPVTTVKTRLQRGLERLRTQLDDEYGERARWSSPMLLLAHPGGTTPSDHPVGPASTAAGHAPSRRIAGTLPPSVAASVAAFLAVGAITIALPLGALDAFFGSDRLSAGHSPVDSTDSVGPTRPGRAARSESRSLASPLRGAQASHEADPTLRDAPPAPSLLSVRVSTVGGAPIEEASVEYWDDRDLGDEPDREPFALTGPRGGATLFLPSRETTLRVTHPDFVTGWASVNPSTSEIAVVLHPGRVFVVRVLDARTEAPIEHAAVRVASISPEGLETMGAPGGGTPVPSRTIERTTDTLGEARLRVEESAILLIEVESVGHARVQRAHPLGPLEETVTFRLGPGGELRLRRRADDQPLALRLFGPVTVPAELGPFEAECEVAQLPPGEYWLVAVRGGGNEDSDDFGADASAARESMDPETLIEWQGRVTSRAFTIRSNTTTTVDLDDGGFDVVVVVDAASIDPTRTSTLVLYRETGELASVATPESRLDTFRFASVSPGRYRLRVLRDGAFGAMDTITVVDRDVEHTFVPGVASLSVSAADLPPLSTAASPIPTLLGLVSHDESRTSEPALSIVPQSGDARLSGLPTGSGRLWAGRGTTISAATVDLLPGENELSPDSFAEPLEVTIEVFEAGRKVRAVVALLPIELGLPDDAPPFACNLDPRVHPAAAPPGTFPVVDEWRLAPGRYRATYGTPDRPPQEREILVFEPATIRLELEAADRFEVEVTREGVTRPADTFALSRVDRSWSVPVQADASGVVTLEVPPGRYRLAPPTGRGVEFDLEPGTPRLSIEVPLLQSPK